MFPAIFTTYQSGGICILNLEFALYQEYWITGDDSKEMGKRNSWDGGLGLLQGYYRIPWTTPSG